MSHAKHYKANSTNKSGTFFMDHGV